MHTKLNFIFSYCKLQCLSVGIGYKKLCALQSCGDHVIYGISTSAHTGDGIAELRAAIARTISTRAPRNAHEFTLGVARVALLQEAADSLDDMLTIDAPELVAAALRTALDRLGEVSGAIPPDDVLGRLFSSFCIGK